MAAPAILASAKAASEARSGEQEEVPDHALPDNLRGTMERIRRIGARYKAAHAAMSAIRAQSAAFVALMKEQFRIDTLTPPDYAVALRESAARMLADATHRYMSYVTRGDDAESEFDDAVIAAHLSETPAEPAPRAPRAPVRANAVLVAEARQRAINIHNEGRPAEALLILSLVEEIERLGGEST